MVSHNANYGGWSFGSFSNPWMLEAACRDMDPDIFMAELPTGVNHGFSGSEEAEKLIEIALDTCRRCPVMKECRDFADRTKTYDGIFGGVIGKQRRKEARE